MPAPPKDRNISKIFTSFLRASTFCVPPSPTAIDLALGHIGHAQISRQDEKVVPAAFKNCREIQLIMTEMRKVRVLE